MRTTVTFVLIISLFLFLTSCSETTNPIDSTVKESINGDENDGSTLISEKNPAPNRGVFGAWRIHLDGKNLTAEIEPARSAHAIGNIFDSDLSQFLTVSPCSNCLAITRVYIDYWQNLCVDFRMKHPFGDITKRPDLHGFDVRLILIMPEQWEQFDDIGVMNPDGIEEPAHPALFLLLNSDGFTSHYDELVTDSRYFLGGVDVPGNLNPFLRFFEVYSMPAFDPHNPSGQNVMAVGSDFQTRKAIFWGELLYMDGLDFYAVADVAYGQSATFSTRQNPQYYLPAFHRTEPWRVEYWIENNYLTESDPTSTRGL